MRAFLLLLLVLPGCGILGPKPIDVEHREVVTESGVRYVEFLAGVGAQLGHGMEATIDYTAKLPDGAKIDSTYDRGLPVTFRMGEAPIRGWNYGLAGMRVGGRRTVVVPAQLAYGDEGVPDLVPPGATLVFEIELLSAAEVAESE